MRMIDRASAFKRDYKREPKGWQQGEIFVLDDSKNGNPRIVPVHPRIRSIQTKPVSKITIQHSFKNQRGPKGWGISTSMTCAIQRQAR